MTKKKQKKLRTFPSSGAVRQRIAIKLCKWIEILSTIFASPIFLDPTSSVGASGLRKFREICPIAVFCLYIPRKIYKSNFPKIEAHVQNGSFHKWYKFHQNRARESPLMRGKQIPRFLFLVGAVNPKYVPVKVKSGTINPSNT